MWRAVLLNDLARGFLGLGLRGLGRIHRWLIRSQIRRFDTLQTRLRTTLGIDIDTPISTYDEALRARVHAMAEQDPTTRIATTSGSTSAPKEIAYPRNRMVFLRLSFALATARIAAAFRVQRPVVFTLASLKSDTSLTALLTWRGAMPSRLDAWMTPHTVLRHPAVRELVEDYGLAAVRMWAMVLSNPRWLYSTNPSTQVVFFQALQQDWEQAKSLLRDWHQHPHDFSSGVHLVARRIVSRGWKLRTTRVLEAEDPLPVLEWLPTLALTSCWDGGSLGGFLAQLDALLPGVRRVPMFSMSTETLETLPVMRQAPSGVTVHFLPLCPGVLYEFLDEAAKDDPALLRKATDLAIGDRVCLVASDPYGLRRYQTEDVFEVRDIVDGLPDLHFLRRRGLTWSFTGEKLTGAQVAAAVAQMREEGLPPEVHPCCIPCEALKEQLPGYRLVLATTGSSGTVLDPAPWAVAFERALTEINPEYADKRASGRLAPPIGTVVPYDRLAAALDPGTDAATDHAERAWESQFKLLPLVPREWGRLGLSEMP